MFAVWADAKGTVYAGSSPDGKVYRHAGGKTSVFYDPDQTYIWELEGDGKGGLLVATGTEGKFFQVDGDGTGKVLYDSDDTHLRSIGVLGDGSFLVGTAGLGLVLRVDGPTARRARCTTPPRPRWSPSRADGAGGAYFAVLASEASLIDLGTAPIAAAARTRTASRSRTMTTMTTDERERRRGLRRRRLRQGGDPLSSGSRPASFLGRAQRGPALDARAPASSRCGSSPTRPSTRCSGSTIGCGSAPGSKASSTATRASA